MTHLAFLGLGIASAVESYAQKALIYHMHGEPMVLRYAGSHPCPLKAAEDGLLESARA